MEMNGAEVLVKSLENLGVKRIYGYTGGAILPVFEALRKSSIDIVINSNEQASTFSAAGHSRSTNEVGVAIVTSGPAITNTLTAVADCYGDSIPLIVISGQVPEHKIGTDAFQHIDVKSIFKDASKKVFLIENENQIERIVKEAYFLAKSGKPGPVVIDFPLDKQNKQAKYENLPTEKFEKIYKNEHHLTDLQCKKFFDLLLSSKKPLLYIGGGLNSEEGSKAIREFNAIFRIPVVNTLMAKGVVDGNDELSLGMLGMFGTPSANYIVQENDLFIAIGVRWDDRVAEKVGCFGPMSKIAYIDINREKVMQIISERDPEFTFVGDSSNALNSLINYAKIHNLSQYIERNMLFDSWRQRAITLKKKWPLNYNKESDFIQEAEVMECLNEFINPKIRITTGVGNHQMLAAQYLNMVKPKSFLSSGSFGTMGFGLPVAIGAYFANPSETIIDVDGDSSICMNLGELRTVGMYNIPIKIIVLNNLGDGMVKNLQDFLYEKETYTGTSRKKDIILSDIAKVCNFKYAKRITKHSELKKSIAELISTNGPGMLEVVTDPKEILYPRIPPGKSYKEMILGPYIKEKPD